MWKYLWITALFAGCGVKQPPIAPQDRPVPVVTSSQVNCSPSDEKCDKRDPNYRPTR